MKKGMKSIVRYGLGIEDRLIKAIDRRVETGKVEEDYIPYQLDENGNKVWSFK
jgi:hypothetical protein